MESNEIALNSDKFTRTISELSLESGVSTPQIHYYLKKNSENLEGHIYKKPGSTNPYMLDDEGYAFLLPILNKVAEKKAEVETEEPKTAQELYDERIADLIKAHEEQIANLTQYYENLLKSKDETIKLTENHFSVLEQLIEKLNTALDQQQKLTAILQMDVEKEPKEEEKKKKGIFSMFSKK